MLKFTTDQVYDGYLKVNSCGQQWLTDRDYNTVREKGRSDYSLFYIARGKATYECNGVCTTVSEGNMILYFPGVRHHYTFKKEDNSELRWAHFSGSACQILAPFFSEKPVVLSVQSKKEFETCFEKMIRAHYKKQEIGTALSEGYLMVLLALTVQSPVFQKSLSPLTDESLEKVLSQMHVYFNQPIDIAKYANMCHWSKDRFIRMFQAYTGFPPYHYQLRIRIERAVEMLENRSVTVAECAQIVGFSDHAYFSRIFKKFTGKPPSYYKKKNENAEEPPPPHD